MFIKCFNCEGSKNVSFKGVLGFYFGVGVSVFFSIGVLTATYSAGVVSPNEGVASVPIVVAPNDGEEVSICGYVIRLTYDAEVVTPILSETPDALGENCYAALGNDIFADGILVSDLATGDNGENQVVVSWAAALPITLTEETTLATVDFQIAEDATGFTTIGVQLIQLSSDGQNLVDDETLISITANGEIQITIENGNIVRGDADGDSDITASDATTILRSVANIELITDDILKENSDADANGGITASDATTVLRDVANIEVLNN